MNYQHTSFKICLFCSLNFDIKCLYTCRYRILHLTKCTIDSKQIYLKVIQDHRKILNIVNLLLYDLRYVFVLHVLFLTYV